MIYMPISGKIIKGIGGFYYVNAADRVYECKARGVFRKDGHQFRDHTLFRIRLNSF